MNTSDAAAAIRDLDALPELRRRHLVVLAADARTDADRTRIVMTAKRENIEQRWATEQAVKAEFSARARWAVDHPERPAQVDQKPAAARRWAEEGTTHDGPRPVTVTWGPITKTATEKQTRERKPLMGTNRKYADAPTVPVPEEDRPLTTPKTGKPVQHGLRGYTLGCRCVECKKQKALSRNPKGRVRRPDGEVCHGTSTQYSRGCRCRQCKDAVAAHARKRRAEKKKFGK